MLIMCGASTGRPCMWCVVSFGLPDTQQRRPEVQHTRTKPCSLPSDSRSQWTLTRTSSGPTFRCAVEPREPTVLAQWDPAAASPPAARPRSRLRLPRDLLQHPPQALRARLHLAGCLRGPAHPRAAHRADCQHRGLSLRPQQPGVHASGSTPSSEVPTADVQTGRISAAWADALSPGCAGRSWLSGAS